MTTASRAPRAQPFAALKHPNYRWYFLSGLGMAASQGIQELALAWLVLDLTGSLATLGAVIFARGVPMLTLGLFGGVLADRYSRRNLLLLNQIVTFINMAAIAVVVLSGAAALWQVYISSALLGITMALTAPARMAIIRSLVSKEDMLNAVALNSFQMNFSRIIWPTMAGGLVVLTGTGGAFAVCAIASFIGIIFMLPIPDTSEPSIARRASPLAEVIEGLRYTASIPVLAMIMAMIVAVGMFGLTYQFMATAFAREALGFSAGEAGIFLMSAGVGSIIGSTALLMLHVENRNLAFIFSVGGFGVSLLLLSLNPLYAGAFLLMGVYGIFSATTPVIAQTIFQIAVPQQYLGRVNSFFSTAPGVAAILSLPIGFIGDAFGLRWAVGGIALILMLFTAIAALTGLHNRELPEAADDGVGFGVESPPPPVTAAAR